MDVINGSVGVIQFRFLNIIFFLGKYALKNVIGNLENVAFSGLLYLVKFATIIIVCIVPEINKSNAKQTDN